MPFNIIVCDRILSDMQENFWSVKFVHNCHVRLFQNYITAVKGVLNPNF